LFSARPSQLDANPDAKAAFIRAAQNWETIILSPITIYIDVDFGFDQFWQALACQVLGSTSTPASTYPYQSVRTNLIAEANGERQRHQTSDLQRASFNERAHGPGQREYDRCVELDARAIGLLPAVAQSSDSASTIAFNSSFTYDFDPSDGISGGTDFDAVATHEIGHALGFDSDAGFSATVARPAMGPLSFSQPADRGHLFDSRADHDDRRFARSSSVRFHARQP